MRICGLVHSNGPLTSGRAGVSSGGVGRGARDPGDFQVWVSLSTARDVREEARRAKRRSAWGKDTEERACGGVPCCPEGEERELVSFVRGEKHPVNKTSPRGEKPRMPEKRIVVEGEKGICPRTEREVSFAGTGQLLPA